MITRPDYWDCECDMFYIHHKDDPHCYICGANSEEQPDSFSIEVAKALYVPEKDYPRWVLRRKNGRGKD